MKHLSRGGALLAIAVVVAGFGPCPRTKADEALAELRMLKDQMCACADRTCAQDVTERLMKMGEKHKDTPSTEAQKNAAAALTEELTRCMTRAMGNDPPPPPASPTGDGP